MHKINNFVGDVISDTGKPNIEHDKLLYQQDQIEEKKDSQYYM